MSKRDNRNPLAIKIDAVRRLLMWHYAAAPLKLVLLSEYPKSGGSWLGEILSDYLDIPFPRNQRAPYAACIMHGHNKFHPHYNGRTIVIHRDGRDVMVSLYWHLLFVNEHSPIFFVKQNRERMPFKDYNDIQTNFLPFMQYIHNNKFSSYKFTWAEFVDSYNNKEVFTIKYEDLLSRPLEALHAPLLHFSKAPINKEKLLAAIEKNNFANVKASIVDDGQSEISFLRKGKAGDWRSVFTIEHAQFFAQHNGKQLIQLGYEKDNTWADQIAKKD